MKERSTQIQVVLVSLLVIAAFIIGSLFTKVKYLERASEAQIPAAPSIAQQQAPAAPSAPALSLDLVKNVFSQAVIKFGDVNKKLVFIEVADPSCPYCHVAAGKNGELNKQMGDRFTLVADGGTYVAPVPEMKKLVESGKAAFAYVYTNGHGNGEMGTKALYCANEKGKFWEVHDLLMSSSGYAIINNVVKNDKTKSGELADFLKSVFSQEQMKKCLDSGKFDGRTAEDSKLATGVGVRGTPGFFINATNFAGAYSWKDMESAVADALK